MGLNQFDPTVTIEGHVQQVRALDKAYEEEVNEFLSEEKTALKCLLFWLDLYSRMNAIPESVVALKCADTRIETSEDFHQQVGAYKRRLFTDPRWVNLFRSFRENAEIMGQFSIEQKAALVGILNKMTAEGALLTDAKDQERAADLDQKIVKANAAHNAERLGIEGELWGISTTDNDTLLQGLTDEQLRRARALAATMQQKTDGTVYTHAFLPRRDWRSFSGANIQFAEIIAQKGQQRPNSREVEGLALKITNARNARARVLGFEHHADRVFARMGSTERQEEILKYLQDLALKLKKGAQEELEEVERFAQDTLNVRLTPNNRGFVSNALKRAKHNIGNVRMPVNALSETTRSFFRGSLDFSMVAIADEAPWVGAQVFGLEGREGDRLYLDLRHRLHKTRGFLQPFPGHHSASGVRVPFQAALFAQMGEQGASLDEARIFTHEMGHLIHRSNPNWTLYPITGNQGTSILALEVPSKMMERLLSIKPFLKECLEGTGHSSDASIDGIIQAEAFQSHRLLLDQVLFALVDLEAHTMKTDFKSIDEMLDQRKKIFEQYAVFQPVEDFIISIAQMTHLWGSETYAGAFSTYVVGAEVAGKWSNHLNTHPEGPLSREAWRHFRENVWDPDPNLRALRNFNS